jgi:protein phosphatase
MGIFNRFFGGQPEDEENPKETLTPETVQADVPEDERKTEPGLAPVKAGAETQPVPTVTDGATRQLPSEKFISVTNARLTFGQASDVGMVRGSNQDSALSFFCTSTSVDEIPDFGIFIVADGMGGHHDGEKASAMTTHIVASEITNHVYVPMVSGQEAVDLPPITEIMIEAVQKANVEVHKSIPKGGGTTCTAVTVLGDRAYIAHVGDSRAYLITKDSIDQITRDHSMVRRLVELGQLTPEEGVNHPRHNELYRALGFKEEVEVDTLSRRIPSNSRLLLCSDGLWNHVQDNEIHNIVSNHPTPQDVCNKLIALANTRGGTDNITVVLLRMG